MYILSSVLPTFLGTNFLGIVGLLSGWIGIFVYDPFVGLPWISNILYLVNLSLPRSKNKIGLYLSVITIVFGLLLIGFRELPINEGRGSDQVTVGIGFGIWILSFVLLFLDRMNHKK